MIQPTQLQAILDTIEGTTFDQVQSIHLLMDWGFKLKSWMAFAGNQQAECKRELHTARRKAMVNLIASLEANGAELAVSLQKAYVDDLCANENYNYELAERTCRACVHSLDFVRTCISTLKTELIQTR
jgi:uncharacterized protein YbjQ (UPF0145 family)